MSGAPKFSVGVDADPMMVEQTIDKTLEEIIKERRKEIKGERERARIVFIHSFLMTLYNHHLILSARLQQHSAWIDGVFVCVRVCCVCVLLLHT